MPRRGPVLVTGATGLQGGAVAQQLLAAGHPVSALVRRKDSPAARALAAAGAVLVPGDMDDPASLDAAMRDVEGVFSVQPTMGQRGVPGGFTPEDEVRLGVNVADAALRAGVRHLVYSSVGGAERDSGIRRWESKWRIERHLRERGLPATVLRPVRFMENQSDPRLGVRGGLLTDVFLPEVPVQLIAVRDIGAFAALAFGDPETYLGLSLELAGDQLTMPQVCQAITEATGGPVAYRPIPRETLEGQDPDALAGYRFANERGGWQADIPALRRLHPGLLTFRAWLEREGRAQFEALFRGEAAAGAGPAAR
ncbi:NmrA/HSCARG family protein [Streptomyces hoynatensis]|uniref:NmrA/HSCARG family protein n=1 Tax=Streptomyces hoynatensis TaxID=1141874 RepID=A0A3A9Z3H6_9ACTN|nr:NmrA/HSCARG family protein [Streptomyces hoynatensis]RKN43022.1 NmrA/HSCARG family protein [Streptomyces hoynatensis]